jgi:hypothetical protein
MKTQAITSLPPSPEDDRRSRMIKYTVAMSIRVVCVVLLVFVRGWAMWIIAAGAIILPYIAVVLANVGNTPPQPDVERPGALVPVGRPARFADEPRGERAARPDGGDERATASSEGSARAGDDAPPTGASTPTATAGTTANAATSSAAAAQPGSSAPAARRTSTSDNVFVVPEHVRESDNATPPCDSGRSGDATRSVPDAEDAEVVDDAGPTADRRAS